MFHRTGRSATFGLVCLALAGCNTNPEARGTDEGIFLLSALGNTCVNENETISFDFNIFLDENGDGIPDQDATSTDIYNVTIAGATGLTDVIDVTDLDLGTDGSGNGLSGLWVGGDYFHLLPPGTYCVTATATGTTVPLLPSNPQTNCDIEVPEGGTAETVFTFQCEGQTISALDIVVLVQEGPSITGWEYSDDKFTMICEDVGMTATFTDLEGGPHNITFEMFADPIPNYAGPGQNDGLLVDSGEFLAEPIPAGNVPHSVTWTPASPSPAGTYYVYVSISDNGTPPLITTFQALLHSYPAATDYCVDLLAEPSSHTEWTTQQAFTRFNEEQLTLRIGSKQYAVKGARFVIDDAHFVADVGTGHFNINSTAPTAGFDTEGSVILAYDADGIDPIDQITFALDIGGTDPSLSFNDNVGSGTVYDAAALDFILRHPSDGSIVGTGSFNKPAFIQDAAVYEGWKMSYPPGNWTITGSGGLLNFTGRSAHPEQATGYLVPKNIITYDNAWGIHTCDDQPVNLNEECAAANLDLPPCIEVCENWSTPAQP